MWTRRGQSCLVLVLALCFFLFCFFFFFFERSVFKVKLLNSYFGIENRRLAFSKSGGLPALPPATRSRTWRGCPTCCRASWGPGAAPCLLPPRSALSFGSVSQLFMEMTPCSGRGLVSFSNDNAIQTWIGRNVMRLLILVYFQCECTQNTLRKAALAFFLMNWRWPDSLLRFLPPKDGYIEKKPKDPLPIPSLFSSCTNIKNYYFSRLHFNNRWSIKILAAEHHLQVYANVDLKPIYLWTMWNIHFRRLSVLGRRGQTSLT